MKFVVPVALYNSEQVHGRSSLRIVMSKYLFDQTFDLTVDPVHRTDLQATTELEFEIPANKLPQKLVFTYVGPHTCVVFEPQIHSPNPLRTVSQQIGDRTISATTDQFCAWNNAWLQNNDALTFRYWLDQKGNESVVTAMRL
jgi:hypothetical protein